MLHTWACIIEPKIIILNATIATISYLTNWKLQKRQRTPSFQLTQVSSKTQKSILKKYIYSDLLVQGCITVLKWIKRQFSDIFKISGAVIFTVIWNHFTCLFSRWPVLNVKMFCISLCWIFMDLCGFEPFVRCENKNNIFSTRTVKSFVGSVFLL